MGSSQCEFIQAELKDANLEKVDEWRETISKLNDGSQPLEPWQRVSQVVFEAWLKEKCESIPLIELRYGWKVEDVVEGIQSVETSVRCAADDRVVKITSDYLIGCDGGSSRVRQSLQIPIDGGPTPAYYVLVHFKSRDLTKLHKMGQFWHNFFIQQGSFKGIIIAQDEVDTWTVHKFIPLDTDEASIDSHEAVYDVLGGIHGPYPIKIDEVLVRSAWRPHVAVSQRYSGEKHRVFIAGDACHQLVSFLLIKSKPTNDLVSRFPRVATE